jgi:hypothetical protein
MAGAASGGSGRSSKAVDRMIEGLQPLLATGTAGAASLQCNPFLGAPWPPRALGLIKPTRIEVDCQILTVEANCFAPILQALPTVWIDAVIVSVNRRMVSSPMALMFWTWRERTVVPVPVLTNSSPVARLVLCVNPKIDTARTLPRLRPVYRPTGRF